MAKPYVVRVQMSEKLAFLEDGFVSCSKGKGFFGGDSVGYVDIVLGCFLGWMRATEIVMDVKYLDDPGCWLGRRGYVQTDVIPTPQKLIDLQVARASD